MNSYRNAEIEYRERCKARIQRQLEISEEYDMSCPRIVSSSSSSFLSLGVLPCRSVSRSYSLSCNDFVM